MRRIMGRQGRQPRDHLQHLHIRRKSPLGHRMKELPNHLMIIYSGKELKLLVP
jgi:hypothetical protein